MKKKKTKIIWRGFIIRLVVLFFLAVLSTGGYYAYKMYSFQKKITQDTQLPSDPPAPTLIETAKNFLSSEREPLKGAERGRVNVLLLGMGGEGHSGKYLTDTIMLASFDPKTYQSALLSIPRDLYVEIPSLRVYTKINAVYAYGMMSTKHDSAQSMEYIKEVVHEVTGQKIDYYVIMNFDGFEHIINGLDGVDVQVEEDILDTRYPGPNFSYQTFKIDKGFHHLDGATALKYARVRHTAGGDFGRARRQQQILAATKKKALSLGTILNPARLGSFIDALGDNMRTNIQLAEIPSFIDIATNINIYQSTNKVLDAWSPDSLLASTHKPLGGVMAYVLMPRAKNYTQVHELANNIFVLQLIERKKQSIEDEKAAIGIILQPKQNRYKIQTIFSKLGYKNVSILYPSTLAKNKRAQDRAKKTGSENDPSKTEDNQQPKENQNTENPNDQTEDASDQQTEQEPVNCDDRTVIFNNSDEPKVFTMDNLAETFDAEVKDEKVAGAEEDIIVCMSKDAMSYLDEQNERAEDEDESLKDQSILDEEGNIRVNKND